MLSIIFQKKLAKIVLVLSVLLLLFFSFEAKAALQIKYPDIQIEGQHIKITVATELPIIIKYWFYWAVIIGALIAFGSLIYGGFRYLTSTGNPEAMKDAMGQIKAAFLGLTILLGSFLVLRMINPQLTTVSYEPITIPEGVVLKDRGIEHIIASSKPSLRSFKDQIGEEVRDFRPTQFQIIGENVKVRFYSLESYNGEPSKWYTYKEIRGAITTPQTTDNVNIGIIKSVEIVYEGPAVYLFNEAGGRPGASITARVDVANLPKAFGWGPKETKYIQIKNAGERGDLLRPTPTSTDLVAVLYRNKDFRGYCRVFYENDSNGTNRERPRETPCSDDEGLTYGCEVNSAGIFNMNRSRVNDCKITLYKDVNGESLAQNERSGWCNIQGNSELLRPTKITDLIGNNKPYSADNCKNLLWRWSSAKVNSISVSPGCAVVAWGVNIAAETNQGDCQYFIGGMDYPDLRKSNIKSAITKIAIYPLK